MNRGTIAMSHAFGATGVAGLGVAVRAVGFGYFGDYVRRTSGFVPWPPRRG